MRLARSSAWLSLGIGWIAAAAPYPVVDDFETGTFADVDAPPGHWNEVRILTAGNTVTPSAAAAHRGALGMRVTDTYGGAGTGEEGRIVFWGPGTVSSMYLRSWVRITTSNGIEDIVLAEIKGWTNTGVAGVAVFLADMSFQLGGYDGTAWTSVDGTGTLPVGQWFLLEMGVVGAGTASGVRRMWINGQLVAEQTGMNLATATFPEFSIGEIWADNRAYVGLIDFDDAVVQSAPPASTLSLSQPSAATAAGQCGQAQIQLLSSAPASAPAAAPYAAAVDLTDPTGNVTFYSDPQCASASTSAVIAAGSSAQPVYFRAAAGGTFTIAAAHLDYLPGSSTWAIQPAGSGLPVYSVGCDCSQVDGWPAAGIAALVLAARRRRLGASS